MNQSMVKAAIVGGIIAFLWGMISWMVLPLHTMTMERFKDEQKVSEFITENVTEDGVYFIPSCCGDKEKMKHSPFMMASIRLKGMGETGMALPMARSLIIQIVGAFLITWMLLKTKGLSYMQKAGFTAIAGLFAGIVALLPGWNWCAFPLGYTIVGMLDLVIGWYLAGLAIAKIAKA